MVTMFLFIAVVIAALLPFVALSLFLYKNGQINKRVRPVKPQTLESILFDEALELEKAREAMYSDAVLWD